MMKPMMNMMKQDKEKFVVPREVQDVIPISAIYDDGIFKIGKDIKLLNLQISIMQLLVVKVKNDELDVYREEYNHILLENVTDANGYYAR